MTIFEMLEKLEAEIAALGTRYQELASALEHPGANGSGPGNGSAKRAGSSRKTTEVKSSARQSKRRASGPKKGSEFKQLELPAADAGTPEEPQTRVLGKRQALGKSLVQLRKMSAWRSGRAPEE